MSTDGRINERMTAFDQGTHWNVADNWVYYGAPSNDGQRRLYKRHLITGEGGMPLCDDFATEINVVGNWVYYQDCSKLPNLAICKVTVDGRDRKCLTGN